MLQGQCSGMRCKATRGGNAEALRAAKTPQRCALGKRCKAVHWCVDIALRVEHVVQTTTRSCITACCCNVKSMSGCPNGTLFCNAADNDGVMMYMLALCSHAAQNVKACVTPSVAQLFSISNVLLHLTTLNPRFDALKHQRHHEKQHAFVKCIAVLLPSTSCNSTLVMLGA